MNERTNQRDHHVAIAKSAVIIFGFLAIAKLVGALKEVAIANLHGTSSVVDGYALTFSLASWPVTVFTMSASMILIPILVQAENDRPGEGTAIFRAVLAWTLAGCIPLGVAFMCAPWILGGLIEERFTPQAALQLRQMTVTMGAMIPIGGMSALLAARLMSGRRFINTLFEAIPSIVVIAAVLLFQSPADAPYALGIGTSLGFFFYAVALLLAQPPPARALLPRFTTDIKFRRPIGRDVLILVIAQMVFSFGGAIIDQLAATQLPPESNAVLGYANRLLMLATGLGATVIGRASLPVFSKAWLEGAGGEGRLAWRWSLALFVLGAIAIAIAYFIAPQVIGLLFHRGAFEASDLRAVTDVLRVGLLQLPFYFSGLIFAQMMASQRRYGVILICNSLAVVAKVAAMTLLVGHFGLAGIMISTAIMYAVSLVAMIAAFLWKRRHLRSARQCG